MKCGKGKIESKKDDEGKGKYGNKLKEEFRMERRKEIEEYWEKEDDRPIKRNKVLRLYEKQR
jgi:hypothetical protein